MRAEIRGQSFLGLHKCQLIVGQSWKGWLYESWKVSWGPVKDSMTIKTI